MKTDLHFAFRQLVKNPGFTAVAVLTLALGIGANTAIFSVVNDLLFRPLPGIKRPSELFAICYRGKDGALTFPNNSFPFYEMYRDECRAFSDFIGYAMIHPKLKEDGRERPIRVELVSANYFAALGVAPVLGRTFSPQEDDVPGRDPVAVISHACWQQRFSGESNVIGRTLIVNNQSLTIIGVAPQSFQGFDSRIVTEIWLPTAMELTMKEHTGYRMMGRLAPGIARQQAIAELDFIGRRIEEKYGRSAPPGYERYGLFRAESRRPDLLHAALGSWGPDRTLVSKLATLFMGAVGLLLLIACANAANLLLIRAFKRRREIAIRLALGAGRSRIIRQLTVESVLLAFLGGSLGILLAHWGNALLLSLRTGSFRLASIDAALDGRVLVFTLGLALVTGIVFGLVPALQALKFDLHPALKEEASSVAGSGRFALRNLLVVAQVAGCLTLLLGAGLCVRSFGRLASIDPGFDPMNVLVASVVLSGEKHSAETALTFADQLMERVRTMAGVQAVSISDELVPLSGSYGSMDIRELDGYEKQGDESISFGYSYAGPDYFRALGIQILQGREFAAHDRRGSSRVAVLNESFVRRYWPNQNPIGKRILGSEVVGIVRDSHIQKLWEAATPHVYRAVLQQDLRHFSLLVKTDRNPNGLIPHLRTDLQALDKSAELSGITTLDRVLSDSLGGQRLLMVLLGVFATLALILASIGLYGVVAYTVAQRVREIGIRMALGARRLDVVKLVVSQGMLLVFLGLIIGVTIALVSTRVLQSYLYEIASTDFLTFVSVPLLLAGVSLFACWLPAHRAAKTDPMEALRHE